MPAALAVCSALSAAGQTALTDAEALIRSHQAEKAETLLTPYLASHPDDAEALTLLARVRLDQEKSDEAEQLLRRALSASPNSPQANDALGGLLLSRRRYPEAMERFETVLATNLHDPQARSGELSAAAALALQARAAGQPQAALKSLQHARENLPDDPTLLTDLGIQAQQMHLLPQASEALTTALALDPQRADALYALARVETDQDHLPAAEQHLRAYLNQRPQDASAHFGLGQVLERQLRTPEATAEFERSIELQPMQTESYYQLGQMALDVHSDSAALPFFQKALARDPRHGGALTGMGVLAYRAKDYPTARRQLTAATQASPDYQPAHYYLGLTLGRLGEKAASDRELQLAIELARKQQGKGTPVSADAGP